MFCTIIVTVQERINQSNKQWQEIILSTSALSLSCIFFLFQLQEVQEVTGSFPFASSLGEGRSGLYKQMNLISSCWAVEDIKTGGVIEQWFSIASFISLNQGHVVAVASPDSDPTASHKPLNHKKINFARNDRII